MIYERLLDNMRARREIVDAQGTPIVRIGFTVEDVRKERTGVHGRLGVAVIREDGEWRQLDYSNINIEKGDERLRVANKAHKILVRGLPLLGTLYTPMDLEDDLREFTAGLWAAYVQADAPEFVAGASDWTPARFLLDPFVIQGGGTILFAPPGRGKSWVTLLMAVAIDAGVQTLWPCSQTRTLFINLERSADSVRNRIGAVNRVLGLPTERRLLVMNARGRRLSDVLPAARRAVLEQGVGFVLLDSISRSGYGDLTENGTANLIIDSLNYLVGERSWLGIAHTPRADESHSYGSIHFQAGCDIEIQLLSQQDSQGEGPLGLGLKIVKDNDVGKRPMSRLALEFEETRGLTAVRRASVREFPELDGGKRPGLRELLREYLLDQDPDPARQKPRGTATATEAAKALGQQPQNVSSMLKNDPWFTFVSQTGRDRFYGVAADPGRPGDAEPPEPWWADN